jgi:hypothetical protein
MSTAEQTSATARPMGLRIDASSGADLTGDVVDETLLSTAGRLIEVHLGEEYHSLPYPESPEQDVRVAPPR